MKEQGKSFLWPPNGSLNGKDLVHSGTINPSVNARASPRRSSTTDRSGKLVAEKSFARHLLIKTLMFKAMNRTVTLVDEDDDGSIYGNDDHYDYDSNNTSNYHDNGDGNHFYHYHIVVIIVIIIVIRLLSLLVFSCNDILFLEFMLFVASLLSL